VPERVLITGGTGFIGLRLATALLDRGASVTLIDNLSRGRLDENVPALGQRVHLVRHDLRQSLPEELPGAPFTQVFHLAAVVGVRFSLEVPHHVSSTNLRSTLNVLDWCARHPPRMLCVSSTSEVADGAAKVGLASVPLDESVPFVLPEPHSARASYALSKMASEQLLVHYAQVYGFAARIMRYHNVYGPRMGYEHVIPQFIDRICARQNPFSIFGAAQTRAFCYVDDAVEATLQVAALTGQNPLVVNIGNDREEVPILDLANKMFDLAAFWPELDIQPPPPGSPDRRRPNLQRLRQVTGFEPRVQLDEGLRRTYDWYVARWRGESNPVVVRS
jgi:UDP-glucose 4-epimerase/UDP-glucuronate decarboxylase